MKTIAIILGWFVGFAIGFSINALLMWLACWGLNAIGIYQIGAWTVQFSFPLVIVFTIVYMILKSIFSTTIKKH